MAAMPAMPFGSLCRPDLRRRRITNIAVSSIAVKTSDASRARDHVVWIRTKYIFGPSGSWHLSPFLLQNGFGMKLTDGFCRDGATVDATIFAIVDRNTAHCFNWAARSGTKY